MPALFYARPVSLKYKGREHEEVKKGHHPVISCRTKADKQKKGSDRRRSAPFFSFARHGGQIQPASSRRHPDQRKNPDRKGDDFFYLPAI
jgi:hypothetical protein